MRAVVKEKQGEKWEDGRYFGVSRYPCRSSINLPSPSNPHILTPCPCIVSCSSFSPIVLNPHTSPCSTRKVTSIPDRLDIGSNFSILTAHVARAVIPVYPEQTTLHSTRLPNLQRIITPIQTYQQISEIGRRGRKKHSY